MTNEGINNENRNDNDSNVAGELEHQAQPGTSLKNKMISRCVSICTDGDCDGFKENLKNIKKQGMHRKRLHPDSFSDGTEKPVLFSPLHAKKRHIGDGNSKYNSTRVGKNTETVKSSSSVPIARHLHLPMSCKSNEHILLNENSLCKEPQTHFSPASPVRSVVSCDGSQYDVEMCDNSECQNDASTSNVMNGPIQYNMPTSTAYPVTQSADPEISLSLPEELQLHMKAVRIEASLAPMKPLLIRLMTHPTYNRKGTFNAPVDHIALGLKDYTTIVKKPMDLGTIKKTLHSNIYLSHADVATDIRTCFQNAISFNPPSHPVHEAAQNLLSFFESNYASILEGNRKKSTHSHLQPAPHTCQACVGRVCKICNEGCLALEPTLVICAGAQCAGAKIRRGIMYYCSPDGSKTWCQRCFTTLPAILPRDEGDKKDVPQHKRDLLKRRNDEDVVERWLTCKTCGEGVHECCVFADEFTVHLDSFECPTCSKSILPTACAMKGISIEQVESTSDIAAAPYTFLSGYLAPEKRKHAFSNSCYDSRTLPPCQIAEFIESKVQQKMVALGCLRHAEKTLTVRVISNSKKTFFVPDAVKRHFKKTRSSYRNKSMENVVEAEEPSSEVTYVSKVIALFQRVDAMDVCLFCMYVQEYDEDVNNKKRVYIAYIDSVEHFRPRELRTYVYHEILVAYFATARSRGFKYGHIWSCPPSRGNSFVFWGHPSAQRTPTKDRLLSWYHQALHHGVHQGVITDIKSLYEDSFQEFDHSKTNDNSDMKPSTHPIMVSPPILEGDFWVEEAARTLGLCATRYFRSKNPETYCDHETFNPNELFPSDCSKCPVMNVVTVLQNDIMVHPSAMLFCRPVNAKALKLNDYHDVIKKPMDLGTITTRCLQGEYNIFAEVVDDIKLVFNNAMRYNPPGHVVHNLASTMMEYCLKQLDTLVKYWQDLGVKAKDTSIINIDFYSKLSMRLGASIQSEKLYSLPSQACKAEQREVMIEESEKRFLSLLSEGPKAVAKCMVGEDVWLLDKRHNHKPSGKGKNVKKESVKLACDGMMKQQESWLCDELTVIVRRLRTDFFVCQLYQEETSSAIRKEKAEDFDAYIAGFNFSPTRSMNQSTSTISQGVADARTGLLEFSQYRNFQFDTVRRAKYSTAMLLFYLRNHNSSGIVPTCTKCKCEIDCVRWRKLNKSFDERRRASISLSIRNTSVEMNREELCTSCYEKSGAKDTHVPIRVTFKRS